jgi:hypothetical protein
MKTYWKIAERDDAGIKTLFHGVKGNRRIPKGEWVESERKWVNDGNSQSYWSGWHVLPSKRVAEAYLTRFKNRRDKLVILRCNIKGNVWPKAHANAPVLLAQFLKLI